MYAYNLYLNRVIVIQTHLNKKIQKRFSIMEIRMRYPRIGAIFFIVMPIKIVIHIWRYTLLRGWGSVHRSRALVECMKLIVLKKISTKNWHSTSVKKSENLK